MALAAYQKLTWVLPGLPFGDGRDGDYSSSTAPTMTAKSCSGTAGSNQLTLGSAGFANGDVLKVTQARGTNAGQYEYVKIISGGGTTTLTLSKNLQLTYQDSGANQAQAIKIPLYRNCTVSSGTWAAPDWDGDTGGELIFAVRGTYTPTGSVSANAKGFRGGAGVWYDSGLDGYCGEGTPGATASQFNSNGNAGGGGELRQGVETGTTGGGGASAATAGVDGSRTNFTSATQYGHAGTTIGSSDLSTMPLAGAGGGGTYKGSGSAGTGGDGAGNITIFARRIASPTGSHTSVGANGGNSSSNDFASGAGAGAGGNILLIVGDADIGTDKFDVRGGTGGTGTGSDSGHQSVGGDAGKGRIAIYYANTLTGSVAGTYYGSYSATQDTSLQEFGGAAMMNLAMQ